eukprot:4530038-Lingulodinium_polyedra.AAC.1
MHLAPATPARCRQGWSRQRVRIRGNLPPNARRGTRARRPAPPLPQFVATCLGLRNTNHPR